LEKVAMVTGIDVKDLDNAEATKIKNKRDKKIDDVEKFQLRKTNGYDYEGRPRPKEKVYDGELLTTKNCDGKATACTPAKKVGFHIVLDGNTWACDPNGPSFTAMPRSDAKDTFVVKDAATNTYFVISPNDLSTVTLPSLSDDNETHRELARMAELSLTKVVSPDAGAQVFDDDKAFHEAVSNGTFVCRESFSILNGKSRHTFCARNIIQGLTMGLEGDECGCCDGECPEPCGCSCGEGRVWIQVTTFFGLINMQRCVTNGLSQHATAWGNAATCVSPDDAVCNVV
jgi:hypothetical protein